MRCFLGVASIIIAISGSSKPLLKSPSDQISNTINNEQINKEASNLQKILDYFKRPIKVELQTEYDARHTQELGNFRSERIARVATRFLTCGDYRQGLARIRCSNPECRQEYFRLFSCKGFYLCPSCSQERTLLFAEYLDEQLLFTLPHRQFVFTLPKSLRVFLRHDQRLFA
jgi:hypothetical protein